MLVQLITVNVFVLANQHAFLNLLVVVVVLVLLTVAAGAFLLYRYLCHNKGAYRTTGEPAPGEDPDQVYNDTVAPIKKEYFI